MDIVSGLKIEYSDLPQQRFGDRQLKFLDVEHNIVKLQIEKLLNDKVIQLCEKSKGDYVSSVFVRQKRDSQKFRMILNLNDHVEDRHFKMDAIVQVIK